MKLHAINKEEPTKKFVGRRRKTSKEESKKHHPITARGLGMHLVPGKMIGAAPTRNPSL
jgi:hypothetical protein